MRLAHVKIGAFCQSVPRWYRSITGLYWYVEARSGSPGPLLARSMAGALPPGASPHPLSQEGLLRGGSRRRSDGGNVDKKARRLGMLAQLPASMI